MPKTRRPRHGSLQIWPRKRAARIIPNVNWSTIKGDGKTDSLLGFILYKVGMKSAIVKDATEKSLTQGKKIYIPVTILEAPNMKIFSVRFYKNGIVTKDVIVSNDKELKRKLNIPKNLKPFEQEIPKNYDDIRLIVYSLPSQTSIKKTPDLIEVAIDAKDKLAFAKSLIGKEISIKDFLKYPLLDLRGVTKGKGTSGPIARFGIGKKSHKSEKGVRRPGTLGPWHPAHTSFRVSQMGQHGFFTRVQYNSKVISFGSIAENNINPDSGFPHFGKIKSNYLILEGSVQGPQKRAILVTPSFRVTKQQLKKKYELIKII